MANIEAAVFDVDGMLLDTREFIFTAYEHTLEVHGFEARDRIEIARHVGKSLQDCYDELAPGGEFDILRATHHGYQGENLHLIEGYEGLHDMLQELRANGIKIGAWSSRHGNLVPSLANAGILDVLDSLVQGDEVEMHKPHPEGLLKSMQLLGSTPERTAMLGDAKVDILAGKAAKVALTVGITHGFGTEEDLRSAEADHIVHSLPEIPPLLIKKGDK